MTGQIILTGLNVLAVEDEMLISMMLTDILEEAGCTVVCAGRLEQAMALARDGAFDIAVLDENLHGQRSYGVADILSARGIPFVFATGYGDTNLRDLYAAKPIIAKPYRDVEVIAAIKAELLAFSGAQSR